MMAGTTVKFGDDMPRQRQENARNHERGAGLAEYALLLVLIFLAALGVVGTFGQELAQTFVDTTALLFP